MYEEEDDEEEYTDKAEDSFEITVVKPDSEFGKRGRKQLSNDTGFGKRLKFLRMGRNMTQKELADALDMKVSNISKVEIGKYSYFNMEAIVKLSDIFDVSLDYLVRGEEKTHKNSVNNSFIQSNVNADNGSTVVNGQGQMLSPEVSQLVHIYESLDGEEKFLLIDAAMRCKRRMQRKQDEERRNVRRDSEGSRSV